MKGISLRLLPLVICLLTGAPPLLCRANDTWINHGNGILNHRSATGLNQKIAFSTVSQLDVKWRFMTGFDVTATPSVVDGAIYFPGWNGILYALKEESGELIWKRNITKLAGEFTNGSRATPVVWKEVLLVGVYGPALVLAIHRHSGHLIWKSQRLDSAIRAIITMSGTAYEGYYYVGVSSLQETGDCCTFQGSFHKLWIEDGSIVWRTSMLPPNSGYYGAAVWGSSPSIDEQRRLVFIGTGNNYKAPKSVVDCEKRGLNSSIQREPDPCHDPLNHADSMMALNLDSGEIIWSRSLQAYDVWTGSCYLTPSAPNCPAVLGPDFDFGESPLIINLDTHDAHPNNKSCLVVAGQKSGVVWALDCDDGSIIWSTAAGPGGTGGGASWGLSSDGKRVYTNIINDSRRNFTLAPRKEVTQGGGWVALEASTGKVLWTVAEPSGALAIGPTSAGKGVVFGTSMTEAGDIYAMDALTGAFLWHSTTGAAIYGGASISESCIFVGNGAQRTGLFKRYGDFVTAFCLPHTP